MIAASGRETHTRLRSGRGIETLSLHLLSLFLRRAAQMNLPVAKLAKSFGPLAYDPKVLATFAMPLRCYLPVALIRKNRQRMKGDSE